MPAALFRIASGDSDGNNTGYTLMVIETARYLLMSYPKAAPTDVNVSIFVPSSLASWLEADLVLDHALKDRFDFEFKQAPLFFKGDGPIGCQARVNQGALMRCRSQSGYMKTLN